MKLITTPDPLTAHYEKFVDYWEQIMLSRAPRVTRRMPGMPKPELTTEERDKLVELLVEAHTVAARVVP